MKTNLNSLSPGEIFQHTNGVIYEVRTQPTKYACEGCHFDPEEKQELCSTAPMCTDMIFTLVGAEPYSPPEEDLSEEEDE